MHTLGFFLLMFVGGIAVALQPSINGRLAGKVGVVESSCVSFAVGTLVLSCYALVSRTPLPPLASAGAQPWWIWSGGLIGAFFVAVAVILVPKLGATTMLALVLAGQLLTSLLFDHFGLLGFPVQPLSAGRLLGVCLLAIGVLLIRIF